MCDLAVKIANNLRLLICHYCCCTARSSSLLLPRCWLRINHLLPPEGIELCENFARKCIISHFLTMNSFFSEWIQSPRKIRRPDIIHHLTKGLLQLWFHTWLPTPINDVLHSNLGALPFFKDTQSVVLREKERKWGTIIRVKEPTKTWKMKNSSNVVFKFLKVTQISSHFRTLRAETSFVCFKSKYLEFSRQKYTVANFHNVLILEMRRFCWFQNLVKTRQQKVC